MEAGLTDAQNPHLCEFRSSIVLHSKLLYLCMLPCVRRTAARWEVFPVSAYWCLSCVNPNAHISLHPQAPSYFSSQSFPTLTATSRGSWTWVVCDPGHQPSPSNAN